MLKHIDLSEDDRAPLACLILGVMLSGAKISTSVLSEFRCKKLPAIHLLMEIKQFFKSDSLSSLYIIGCHQHNDNNDKNNTDKIKTTNSFKERNNSNNLKQLCNLDWS